MDGISQPAITGFTSSPFPGQQVLAPGTFLLGETGDSVTRPSWAKDGSFLAFRQLKQLVPEFSKFLADNPIVMPGVLTSEQGSALLGARMVGRWKSVCAVGISLIARN
jgi:deferrochelatase/peroxidase EfeB